MAEGDYVTSIGTWKINGQMQWDWVQTFRVEDGKLAETWLPAMAMEGKWALDEIPEE
jgi:predicted SnoaL-like aldol condensation-catalyzing enzyme